MDQSVAAESSTSAYAHISRASAAKAIQQLDSYAFPIHSASSRASEKKRRVADVLSSPSKKPSPHFSALAGISQLYRERARQRRSQRLSLKSEDDKGKAREEVSRTYQPFSLPLLLSRLSTFSVSTYSHKPSACANLDAVQLSMQGWYHQSGDERDLITCATCKAQWKVQIAKNISDEEQIEIWQLLDQSVLSKHDAWCPWRLKKCHSSLFKVPVHAKLETVRELVKASEQLAQCKNIGQVDAYGSGIEELDLAILRSFSNEDIPTSCILLALLGWKLTEPPGAIEGCVVQCDMCARKLGLWNFLSDRPNRRRLDVVKEHKLYCPFINAHAQSGGETTKTTAKHLNAWEQRMQTLRGNQASTDQLLLSQHDVRNMRSGEAIAKFRTIIM